MVPQKQHLFPALEIQPLYYPEELHKNSPAFETQGSSKEKITAQVKL